MACVRVAYNEDVETPYWYASPDGETFKCGCNKLYPLDGELCDEWRGGVETLNAYVFLFFTLAFFALFARSVVFNVVLLKLRSKINTKTVTSGLMNFPSFGLCVWNLFMTVSLRIMKNNGTKLQYCTLNE